MTVNTYRASAYLAAAEKAGVRVAVGTDRPDILGALNPGGSLTLDFHAPEKAAKAIADFVKEYPIDAVISVPLPAIPKLTRFPARSLAARRAPLL